MNHTSRKPLMRSDLLQFARDMRKSLTDPERILWSILRNRNFLGLKIRRQHPYSPYILDFYCEELSLAIELDGGQHNAEEGRQYDNRRSAFLNQEGIHVIRFWNHDVLEDIDSVVEAIVNYVDKLRLDVSEK